MATEPDDTRITGLLHRMQAGDQGAAVDLLPLVYAELQLLARGLMGRERDEHTLQPTALVHEAWIRMVGSPPAGELVDRQHFYGVAARAMRSVLVDHARARATLKRGADASRLPLDQVIAIVEGGRFELLALNDALDRLAERDTGLAEIVELRFFAGLTLRETGNALGLSVRQVHRSWGLARGFLHRELSRDEETS